jgi:hypothetical protein
MHRSTLDLEKLRETSGEEYAIADLVARSVIGLRAMAQ